MEDRSISFLSQRNLPVDSDVRGGRADGAAELPDDLGRDLLAAADVLGPRPRLLREPVDERVRDLEMDTITNKDSRASN